MRAIKFKCWVKETQNMLILESTTAAHNHYLQIGSSGFWLYDSTAGNLRASSETQDILLQFAGLLDKSEKEIYEGDVVRILYTDWPSKSFDDPRTIAEYMKDIASIGKIVFVDASFCVAFPSKNYPGEWNYGSIFPGTHGYIEVIGNIYEHPNLIK